MSFRRSFSRYDAEMHSGELHIITIDGPAGVGKSTVARGLAARLSFDYLDTGAMYRAVGWKCLAEGVATSDAARVAEVARDITLQFDAGRWLCCGSDVTDLIRAEEVSAAASQVAAIPAVRERLVELQRIEARNRNIVCEGRDQGTLVFPKASCKFFLTASPEIRAQRRADELDARGTSYNWKELVQSIRERDERDSHREIAPLIPAEDAQIVDTGEMSAAEVIDTLQGIFRTKVGIVSCE